MTPEDVAEWFRGFARKREAIQRLTERAEAAQVGSFGASLAEHVGGGDVSDPTAARAARLMSIEAELESAREDFDACLGKLERVCDGIGEVFGWDVKFIVIDHYLNGLTWSAVARNMGISKSSATLYVRTAFEWIANVGWARAEEGVGNAEL